MKVGFNRTISRRDVSAFARLTGDFNPLHLDDRFSRKTQFKGTIVHGMLASSLFSALIGMYCPGMHSLILSQEIYYMKPIRPGESVRIEGRVAGRADSIKVITVKASILRGRGEDLIDAVIKVKMMR